MIDYINDNLTLIGNLGELLFLSKTNDNYTIDGDMYIILIDKSDDIILGSYGSPILCNIITGNITGNILYEKIKHLEKEYLRIRKLENILK